MVLFASRAEINEVFDTFSDTSASNPNDTEQNWIGKVATYSDVEVNAEQSTQEIPLASIIQDDSSNRPHSPVKVCPMFVEILAKNNLISPLLFRS